MPVPLNNQTALIIGASSGIGRATAVLFARAGARVMASARREDRLRELQSELALEGQDIQIHSADAGSVSAMEALAKVTAEKLGPIDIVVYVTGTNIKERTLKVL